METNPQGTQPITIGLIAKGLLAWSQPADEVPNKTLTKRYLNRLFPTISSAELLSRTKKVHDIMVKLKENGWLESTEYVEFQRYNIARLNVLEREGNSR